MNSPNQPLPSKRLLIVMPSPLGDAVMAMPTVAALRSLFHDARITALVRAASRPVVDGCPWIDRVATIRPHRGGLIRSRRNRPTMLARRIATGQFDTAVLLPNSFRTALLARMAGIPRRVGYDRDGRGFLLTDRLLPRRGLEGFIPVPTRDYYLGIARYLGAINPDATLRLFTRRQHDLQTDQILANAGYDPADSRSLILISPGAAYGDAKMWYPERFAEVARRCVLELGAVVAITGAPNERAILDQVVAATDVPILDLPRLGINLTLLKSVVRRSRLVITNDTGPRHMAAAFNIPVVTIFGPTDPAWTHIHFEHERQVKVDVFCGPCQKKKCPLDHRCMTQIHPDQVFQQASALLAQPETLAAQSPG